MLALGTLKAAIDATTEEALGRKLLFAFTAILTRASKRYQWSRKRPLNAANANYYVAPVFYEWNVLDLFSRKVEAIIRSDQWIRSHRGGGPLFADSSPVDVTYEVASAEHLPLPDNSVDYVFTDPPFGSKHLLLGHESVPRSMARLDDGPCCRSRCRSRPDRRSPIGGPIRTASNGRTFGVQEDSEGRTAASR